MKKLEARRSTRYLLKSTREALGAELKCGRGSGEKGQGLLEALSSSRPSGL